MNQYIVRFIKSKMDDAGHFVCSHMPIDMTADEIYEELIGHLDAEGNILRAFQAAVKFLPPSPLNKRISVAIGGHLLTMQVSLPASTKYPQWLLPNRPLFITHGSKLAQALALPMDVARQWAMLGTAWEVLALHEPNGPILVFLMPWLREILAEFDITALGIDVTMGERRAIESEMKKMLQGDTPRMFPRMTEELNTVCKSGRALFGQYRMIEATLHNKRRTASQSPIVIERTVALVPQWLREHLNDVTLEWEQDKIRYARQAHERVLAKKIFGDAP